MSSLKRHEGYIIVDHRASPGLPEDIARAAGFDPKQCGEGQVYESATLTCSHCGTAFVKNVFRTRERGYCSKCDHYICDYCDAARREPGYTHMPIDKVADLVDQGVSLSDPPSVITL
jgi:hypothetical protein